MLPDWVPTVPDIIKGLIMSALIGLIVAIWGWLNGTFKWPMPIIWFVAATAFSLFIFDKLWPKHPTVTPENAAKYLREWIGSNTGVTIKSLDHPGADFAFSVTFDDGTGFGLSRQNDPKVLYVVAKTHIDLGPDVKQIYDSLPRQDQNQFVRLVIIEAGNTGLSCQVTSPFNGVDIWQQIPLGDLTKESVQSMLERQHVADAVLKNSMEYYVNDISDKVKARH